MRAVYRLRITLPYPAAPGGYYCLVRYFTTEQAAEQAHQRLVAQALEDLHRQGIGPPDVGHTASIVRRLVENEFDLIHLLNEEIIDAEYRGRRGLPPFTHRNVTTEEDLQHDQHS